MPGSAKMVVLINPASAADEQEFNRWYDEVHVPQVVERIPGIVGATRLRLTKEQLLPEEALPSRRYLTIYDVETNDVQATADRLGTALGDGTLDLSSAVDFTEAGGPQIHFYGPVS
ncbi:hypothetical protein [Pseudonocardia oroxyli]|uniref:EthD domain-containing protein n=1 Tax=Pseudonocardia oroxyli TaxID=366584 RepID=A0A1G7SU93_PSEOR|nr:hypothetical protein [Pseudonocardia oroxyli]SDG26354.1 hypothetical protein SAMN05216377_11093 [Pseudonocardia oroxyli]